DARLAQALSYMQRFDHDASIDGAIAILEDLVRSEGESAPLLAALARAYVYKHQLSRQRAWEGKAAAACARARALGPELPEVSLALGELHLAAGRWSEALARFDVALSIQPELYEALLGSALALDAMSRSDDAHAKCLAAIDLRPADWRGYHT